MILSHIDFIESFVHLADGRSVMIKVKGRSMYPLMRDGRDFAVICATTSIAKGDVVLARIGANQCVLHRVIKKQGENLILMGDGNIYTTESCLCSDVKGTLVRIERGNYSISVTGVLYRIYSALWVALTPLRGKVWKLFCLLNIKKW
ncbi:MAG: S24/S26 family peptidase [Bacteroidales bacterium]